MARKRAPPLIDPPPASSSEEEEETSSGEEEEASSSSEEEEEEQQLTKPSDAKKKPPSQNPTAAVNSQSESSSSESGSGSMESDSDAGPKPIASKPGEQTPKVKEPRSKPSANSSTAKRPSENSQKAKDSKRAKQTASADNGTPATDNDSKKSGDDSRRPFQRLWSEGDEIAILKGMVDYSAKMGADPLADLNSFHEYIQKSLHIDVSKSQISEKIRRMKRKYAGNNGGERTFSKPHDQKAFELSKQIWGGKSSGGRVEQPKSEKENRKSDNEAASKAVASPKGELFPHADASKEVQRTGTNEMSSLMQQQFDSLIPFDKLLGGKELEDFVLKTGLQLIEPTRRAELEGKWRSLQIAQWEHHLKRLELIVDQTKSILEAYKSSTK